MEYLQPLAAMRRKNANKKMAQWQTGALATRTVEDGRTRQTTRRVYLTDGQALQADYEC